MIDVSQVIGARETGWFFLLLRASGNQYFSLDLS